MMEFLTPSLSDLLFNVGLMLAVIGIGILVVALFALWRNSR